MSIYEIQDLISTWVNTGFARMSFWVSITFAVIVAAFVGADEMNGLTVSVLILLYTMVTVTFGMSTYSALSRVALLLKAERALADTDPAVAALIPGSVAITIRSRHTVVPLLAITYIGVTLYVLRAGHVL